MELGCALVLDMCHTSSTDGSQIIVCSPIGDGIIAAVGLHDGKIRWKKTGPEFPLKVNRVCTDNLERVFAVSTAQHSISILSAEDGSLIARLSLDPPVFQPSSILFHEDKLWVAHVEHKSLKKDNEWKWQISQYDIE